MAGRKFALAFVAITLGLSTASAGKLERSGFGYTAGGAHSRYQSCHDAQSRLIKGGMGGLCASEKEAKSK
jgi:hypothetical protein